MTTPKVTTAIVMTVRMIDVGSTMNVSIDTLFASVLWGYSVVEVKPDGIQGV
jgi:hypothetical protein